MLCAQPSVDASAIAWERRGSIGATEGFNKLRGAFNEKLGIYFAVYYTDTNPFCVQMRKKESRKT